jgi:hypothetical protein
MYQFFGGSTARNQQEAGGKQSSLGLLLDLKMEAMPSFETSVDLYQITWRYIPEDGTLNMVHLPYFYPAFIYRMEY